MQNGILGERRTGAGGKDYLIQFAPERLNSLQLSDERRLLERQPGTGGVRSQFKRGSEWVVEWTPRWVGAATVNKKARLRFQNLRAIAPRKETGRLGPEPETERSATYSVTVDPVNPDWDIRGTIGCMAVRRCGQDGRVRPPC